MFRWFIFGVALLACGLAGAQVNPAPPNGLQTVLAPLLAKEGLPVTPPRTPTPSFQKTIPQVTPAAGQQRVVAGLMVRFGSEEAKARSRENLPPPADLLRRVLTEAPAQLTYRRAMSMDMFVFEFPSPLTVAEAAPVVEALMRMPGVDHVEMDAHAKPARVPNDPYLKYQHNLVPQEVLRGGINAWDAWDYTTGSPNVVVAILDTGFVPHADLRGRFLAGYDFVSDVFSANDGNGRDGDASDPGDWMTASEASQRSCGQAGPSSWHGTHVAGIVGAQANNGIGIAGIDWQAALLPVRVLGKCSSVSDVLDGMLWAAGLPVPQAPLNQRPAHVINMSLGAYSPQGCTAMVQGAVQRVKAKGALVVVAAGNDTDEAAFYVPASCQGVVTVGAVDWFGLQATYSNYSFLEKVAISAPGGDAYYGDEAKILSTVNTGSTVPAQDAFEFYQGTSMAAPHVAGVASLALAANPNLSGAELAALLQISAHAFDANSVCTNYWPMCGVGIVNAANAVRGAVALRPYAVVTEFYNPDYRHYFRTGDRNEPAIVESGAVGNWINTEGYFIAWRDGSEGASPVCRFYSARFNSHFYTVDPAECEWVKANNDWKFEGIAFYAMRPVGGRCQSGVPIHRFYNNRHLQSDGNHRFTQYKDFYAAQMASAGWIYEGVALCAAA